MTERSAAKGGLTPRLFVASAVLLVLIAIGFALTLRSLARLHDANRQLERSLSRLTIAQHVEKLAIDLENGLRGFVITGDPAFLQPRDAAVRDLPSEERALLAAVRGDRRQYELAQQAVRRIRSYDRDFVAPQVARARRSLALARRTTALGEGKRRVDAIRRDFLALEQTERVRAAQVHADSDRASSHALLFALLGLALCPLLVLLYAAYLSRLVFVPIQRVAAAARRIAGGDLGARVAAHGVGEAAELGEAFNTMAAALEERNAELETQQGELERTLGALADEQERTEAFHRVVTRISAEADLERLADVLLTELGAILDADAGTLYVLDPTDLSAPHMLVATRGFEAERLPERLLPGVGLAGRAVIEQRTIATSHEARGLPLQVLGEEAPVRHELHVPFLNHGRVTAVASFARVGEPPFGAPAREAIARLAEPVAVGLARTIAYRVAQHHARVVESVLETAQDAYIAVDAEMRICAWSPQGEALFGFAATEAIGRTVTELVIPERHRARYAEGHAELLAQAERDGGATRRFEFRVRHKDGHEFVIELSVAPVRVGGAWRFNGFVRDITSRVQHEREREARSAVSRVLAETEGTAALVDPLLGALGAALRWPLVAYWAPDEEGVLRCAGLWRADGVRGTEALEQRLRSAAFAPGTGLVGGVWESGRASWTRTAGPDPVIAQSTQGTGLQIAAAVPVGRDGHALGVVQFWQYDATPPDDELFDTLDALGGLVVQVAERRGAEARADRMKDEFFALVSHELRTPLTSIVGYIELVLEGDGGDLTEQQAHFLGVVERNARRLQRLVGDLLFVAQVEAGTLHLELGVADLARIAVEAVDAAAPRAEQLGVTLRADVEPVPAIEGDRDRLGQLVDNLVSNALKFTPAGGEVTVRLRSRTGELELVVRDTGIGIPAEEQQRLFDRFYRASAAVEREIPGMGLGLSICQAIAAGHGGRIEVESETGRGTTFRIVLPMRPVPAPEAPPELRTRRGA